MKTFAGTLLLYLAAPLVRPSNDLNGGAFHLYRIFRRTADLLCAWVVGSPAAKLLKGFPMLDVRLFLMERSREQTSHPRGLMLTRACDVWKGKDHIVDEHREDLSSFNQIHPVLVGKWERNRFKHLWPAQWRTGFLRLCQLSFKNWFNLCILTLVLLLHTTTPRHPEQGSLFIISRTSLSPSIRPLPMSYVLVVCTRLR